MLNAQGEIKGEVSLVVKHTLDYKGIGRRYPKYYIYEVSQIPTIITLKESSDIVLWNFDSLEKIRYIENLKILNLSSEREIRFIYSKERITLGCEELWKAKKRTKVISVEDIVNLANNEDTKEDIKIWFNHYLNDGEIDKTIERLKGWRKDKWRKLGDGISEEDIEALRERKVIFSTEVTIFNHGIVEIETYQRGSK